MALYVVDTKTGDKTLYSKYVKTQEGSYTKGDARGSTRKPPMPKKKVKKK
tara:strand:- start:36 stop:185 length:150 start_codon:yes stop_codon:yes gene_type:complete